MTYCCGILVRDGMVMIADTRTNAGLDNISTFRKLHTFIEPGERVHGACHLGEPFDQPVGGQPARRRHSQSRGTGEVETLKNAPTMFQAASRIGNAIAAFTT